jgi:type IV pilus assembly protein PilW
MMSCNTNNPTLPDNLKNGFTLVELMIALVISSIICAGVYSAYLAQQRSQVAQAEVVKMQANLRSLMSFLSAEIRLVGYDSDTGITSASGSSFGFKADYDDDGSTDGDNEFLEYGFKATDDADGDGEADDGAASFCRRRTNVDASQAGYESLADNIVAVEFLYLLKDESDNGEYDPETKLNPDSSDYDDIRAVQISILARTKKEDSNYTNSSAYTTASGAIWGPYDDNYRRRMLVTTVKLRNLGLEDD